jgi:hypothetical protein
MVSFILQLVLIAFTVWIVPTRVAAMRFRPLSCILGVPLLWFAFFFLALYLDGLSGNHVPGVGYLIEGFVSCVIGFLVFLYRIGPPKDAQPGASPNGGPAKPLAKSGTMEGPPSVS